MYVTIHELAHLGVNTTNHDDVFWHFFGFLLSESDDIYKRVDYKKQPVYYCNILINS